MKQHITTLALVVIAVTMSINTFIKFAPRSIDSEGVEIVAELTIPFKGGENDSVTGNVYIKGKLTEGELAELMDAISKNKKVDGISFSNPLKKIF